MKGGRAARRRGLLFQCLPLFRQQTRVLGVACGQLGRAGLQGRYVSALRITIEQVVAL
jgi:hypothetical protein